MSRTHSILQLSCFLQTAVFFLGRATLINGMHLTVETGNVTVIDIGLVGWHSCVNKIFECIMLMSAACPRKKTVDGTYVNLNKTKLEAAFDHFGNQ